VTRADDQIFESIVGQVTDAARKGWWWWPLAAGGAVALLAGVVIGRWTESDGGTRTASSVVDADGLLGPISGASIYSFDRAPFAWPGQVLTAPIPTTGKAVAWQWELCDPPPSHDPDGGVGRCRAVARATSRRWESPPTDTMRMVQVLVTVDMGDRVRVAARSAPVAAVPWPETVTPGDPPPTIAPPTTAPPSLPVLPEPAPPPNDPLPPPAA
jgi:hypothetical protein